MRSHTDETNLTMLTALVTTILWLGCLDYFVSVRLHLYKSCGIVRCCGGMFIQVNLLLMTLYK